MATRLRLAESRCNGRARDCPGRGRSACSGQEGAGGHAIFLKQVWRLVIVGVPTIPAHPHLTIHDIDAVVSMVWAAELQSEIPTVLFAAVPGLAALAVSDKLMK